MAITLNEKLNALKVPGVVTDISQNGFYTNYKIAFNPDITISKIRSRLPDLEMFFSSKVLMDTENGYIILKVEKNSRQNVGIYEFTNDIAHGLNGYNIPLIIGQQENGSRLYYDLTKCPHILVGGSTGSGKSVFMHNLILSILYNDNTALMMIDVKRVEFSVYDGIKRLVAPICYDSKTALNALKNLCFEMDKRYSLFQNNGCRNIQEYNQKVGKMQYIALFIDELADLMMSNKKIEPLIIRLAQLGRAAGIHLVVATQRPDSNILSGLIRANIPTRVCFAVQKATDSRIILDISGGEKLKGAGDGLFIPIGSKNPIRFQAPFISTEGIQKAVNIVKSKQ